MSRELRRNIYCAFAEVMESKLGAPALPIGAEVIDSSKGNTGHGAWLDAAIDFFDLAGANRRILDGLYMCSIADTRKPYTTHEKRIATKFWREVRAKGLDDMGLFIMEMQ